MRLRQAKHGVSIEGHPAPSFNGLYTHDSTHEGWPVLKNANGKYCYRYTFEQAWRVGPDHSPNKDSCSGHIVAKEGPLPVGAHTWLCWVDSDWKEHTLTVTLQAQQAWQAEQQAPARRPPKPEEVGEWKTAWSDKYTRWYWCVPVAIVAACSLVAAVTQPLGWRAGGMRKRWKRRGTTRPR